MINWCSVESPKELTQSKTLAQTDHDTATNKASNIPSRREHLDESCNNHEDASSSHTDSAPEVISDRSSKEEPCHDSTDSVSSIDCSNCLRVLGNTVSWRHEVLM
jgi:hypothetical protein